ncbi:hypothetical protein CHL76_09225 [Marinococcus halophilus]|uniref:Uncharacterized protein n=1 Tax=Marinococcus halophilus TaxID=1371 RepID=A0A510Y4U1_MARHA|nr:hypothetical protein [Marinococcus halophilus]OZT80277.1 hypothetical protein CHL76_09225 [Marinococcus halophilus]GEK58340.1 hypothetical protein MHA01_12450 [Marinococcus halophilus]
MTDGLKHITRKEMVNECGDVPRTLPELTKEAEGNSEIACLLPFYVYYFHTYEWQEYSLMTEHALPGTLNHAVFIALDTPSLQASAQMKRYFYGLSFISRLPEDRKTVFTLEEWTLHVFRKYYSLTTKAALPSGNAKPRRTGMRIFRVM